MACYIPWTIKDRSLHSFLLAPGRLGDKDGKCTVLRCSVEPTLRVYPVTAGNAASLLRGGLVVVWVTQDTERQGVGQRPCFCGQDIIWHGSGRKSLKRMKIYCCLKWPSLALMIPRHSLTGTLWQIYGLKIVKRKNSGLCAEKSQWAEWKWSILFGWLCVPSPYVA